MIRIISILFLSIAWIGLDAQEKKWQLTSSLGIDMGVAIPIPLSEAPEDADVSPRIMPTFGVAMQYYLSEKWSLGLEMNYHILAIDGAVNVVSQPFWSDDRSYATYFSGEAHTTTELRFIEFPLNVNFHLNEHWALELGAYYSYILQAKLETEGKNGWLSTNKEDTDNAPLPGTQNTYFSFNDELDNYDLGGLFGLKYHLNSRVIFWTRLNVGLKSIFKPEFNNIDYDMYQLRFSMGGSFVLWRR